MGECIRACVCEGGGEGCPTCFVYSVLRGLPRDSMYEALKIVCVLLWPMLSTWALGSE